MRWTLLTVLILSLTAAVWAGEPSSTANLITSGTVWTNTVALPSGSTVRSGDRIKTDTAGTALILSPTVGRVEVRGNSEVTFAGDQITLHHGVIATGSLPVQLGDVRIQVRDPSPRALVVVANRDGKQLIAAHRGAALITQAGLAPVLVPAGSYAMPGGSPGGDGQTATKDDDDDDSGGGAVPAGKGSAAKEGWTIGSMSHQASITLVAAVGATAAAGTIAGVALTGSSASPSN